jgi:hypothetical protein
VLLGLSKFYRNSAAYERRLLLASGSLGYETYLLGTRTPGRNPLYCTEIRTV